METLAIEKQALRRSLRERIAAIPPGDRAVASEQACRKFVASAYFACARVVMLYAPTHGECDVSLALLEGLRLAKVVALPRVDWDHATMSPLRILAFPGGLVEGRNGILEPPADAEPVAVGDLDLVITPGVGFDSSGGRLGRGAGFYDRFLAGPSFVGLAVALALEAQIVDHLPMRDPGTTDLPDRRMDAVFTERRIILGTECPRPDATG